MRSDNSVSIVFGLWIAVMLGIIGFFAITSFNSESTTGDKVINKYYHVVDTETKEYTRIRVSEGSGGSSKSRESNDKSNMVIETEMLDIEVSKSDLEVIKDNDKSGTYDVITYNAYPKLISSGMKEEVKKYVAYVPE